MLNRRHGKAGYRVATRDAARLIHHSYLRVLIVAAEPVVASVWPGRGSDSYLYVEHRPRPTKAQSKVVVAGRKAIIVTGTRPEVVLRKGATHECHYRCLTLQAKRRGRIFITDCKWMDHPVGQLGPKASVRSNTDICHRNPTYSRWVMRLALVRTAR